ncbi:MAG TPA: MerR family transcriptional regulator [Chloroflexota bacterium]|jgi:MerR family transcriptional regulator/heat shock protein HspR|nr:MerR family transcriptional regulator [Chloroflexota bacterium]
MFKQDEPCFTIGVVHQMLGLHPQTLRHYERLGLVRPQRSDGRIRMYSAKDLERIALIKRWIDEFGVNLAGVEIMLKMQESMEQLRVELERQLAEQREQYESEVRRLKDALVRVTSERG